MSLHVYAVGDIVSFNVQEGQSLSKPHPFTVEAQLPPVGTSLQYRIKSTLEAYRRVVAEHQLSQPGSQPSQEPTPIVALHSGEEG